ncbi:carboxymuconolactone decarboxylase family protein [Streptomyces mirabilis]|uniref:carboxymuconolactone decarboxylase family protein n=1 Tax=Streptomyces mirabilis TaxID=68239 RepID=UPI0036B2DADD
MFRTLARLGSIFPAHSLFLSQILLRGQLSRTEKELVILRVAWRRGCAYEWAHHVHRAGSLAIPDERIDTMAQEQPTLDDDPRLRALIQTTDELLDSGALTDTAWSRLTFHCSADEAMELCLLVGHYVMVGMTLNATGVQLEDQLAQELEDRTRHRRAA